ncbi:ESPR domain-containing protein, partial [Burkholderia pseudomallei]|uniref:ESPR domain-containing protein n=1 Tax=Burkholderia pseudomallei TaxID=28450 RepID=UPI0021F6AEA2
MNRAYRSIWNESLGAWVAASELDSAHGKGKRSASVKLLVSLLLATLAPAGYASTYTGSLACTSGAGTVLGHSLPAQTSGPVDGSGTWSNVAGCNAYGGGYGVGFNGVTLFGTFATASGDGAVGIGLGTLASQSATAVGSFATASGTSSSAYGFNATASATGATALGSGIPARAQNAGRLGRTCNF